MSLPNPATFTVLSYRHWHGSPQTHPRLSCSVLGERVGPLRGSNRRAQGSDEVILKLEDWENDVPGGWVDVSLDLLYRIWLLISWLLCHSIWPFSNLCKSTRGLGFSVIDKSSMNGAWEDLTKWERFWNQFILDHFPNLGIFVKSHEWKAVRCVKDGADPDCKYFQLLISLGMGNNFWYPPAALGPTELLL